MGKTTYQLTITSVNSSEKRTGTGPLQHGELEKRERSKGNLEVAANEVVEHGGQTSKVKGKTTEFVLYNEMTAVLIKYIFLMAQELVIIFLD